MLLRIYKNKKDISVVFLLSLQDNISTIFFLCMTLYESLKSDVIFKDFVCSLEVVGSLLLQRSGKEKRVHDFHFSLV